METKFITRPKNDTEAYIQIQLKHLKVRYRFSTPYTINIKEWGSGYPKEKNSTKALRDNLATLKDKLDTFITNTIAKLDRVPTKSELNDRVKEVLGKEKATTVKAIFEAYKAVKYHTIALTTQQQIDLAFGLLFAFNPNIELADINKQFAEKFTAYITKQGYLNQTTNKHLKNIKTFLNWCYTSDLTTINLSKYFQNLEAKEKEIIALTSVELTILETGVLKSDKHKKVRDLFLFSCYTSLAFNEVKKFSKEMVSFDSEAKCEIISIKRGKTKEIQTILEFLPLNGQII